MNIVRQVLLLLLCLNASSCVATAHAAPEPSPPQRLDRFSSYRERELVVVHRTTHPAHGYGVRPQHARPLDEHPSPAATHRGAPPDRKHSSPKHETVREHDGHKRKAHGRDSEGHSAREHRSHGRAAPGHDGARRNAHERSAHKRNVHGHEVRKHDAQPNERRGKLKSKRGKKLGSKAKHRRAVDPTSPH